MKTCFRIVRTVEPSTEAKDQAEHHCCSQGALIQEHIHIVREVYHTRQQGNGKQTEHLHCMFECKK